MSLDVLLFPTYESGFVTKMRKQKMIYFHSLIKHNYNKRKYMEEKKNVMIRNYIAIQRND